MNNGLNRGNIRLFTAHALSFSSRVALSVLALSMTVGATLVADLQNNQALAADKADNAKSHSGGNAKAGAKNPKQGGSAQPKPKVTEWRHLNNAECNAYLSRLHEKLDSNWFLVDGHNKVTITSTVSADGSTADIQVSSTPSNPEAEQAANEAFVKAQPLEALPGSAGSQVKLTVVFQSFADPHGDSDRHIYTTLDPVKSAPTQ